MSITLSWVDYENNRNDNWKAIYRMSRFFILMHTSMISLKNSNHQSYRIRRIIRADIAELLAYILAFHEFLYAYKMNELASNRDYR